MYKCVQSGLLSLSLLYLFIAWNLWSMQNLDDFNVFEISNVSLIGQKWSQLVFQWVAL